jgi:hypothetical protein
MKHLRLLCLCTTMLSAESTYLLPHRWQDARHALTETIRTAPVRLVVAADAVDDTYLRRALRRAAKAQKRITLITGSEKTASQWAIYKTVDACLLPASAPLAFSLVVADGGKGCSVGLPLTTEAMRSRYGVMQCTDAEKFDETLRLLRQECRDYFQR